MPAFTSELLSGRRALVTGGTRGIGAATAQALADAGVRINVVSPGLISTSRIAELAAEHGTNPDALTTQIAASMQIPLQRAGTAQEAAQLILFLVSPAASYLTGAQFSIDGGAFPTL
jgi:3alpha(or 20beta)-hydroxysteroid dehydrogenase